MFKCSKCGACCRKAKTLLAHVLNFPYQFDENGTCEKFDPEKGCTVYKDRPEVCRVESVYPFYEKTLNISKETYYNLSSISCNKMMDELGIDQSFRLKVK